MNILLLGETGVGKSTWINGFVNYLTYSSLKEAENYPPPSLIASSYTFFDNDKVIKIKSGEDKNEDFSEGQSATQNPKSYVFDCGDCLLRIIDTPGTMNTHGIEIDKKNFDRILRYLSNLDELHGICILLRPSEERLTSIFRYCIKALLTHLHRSASCNKIFCFTIARNTFFRPGETLFTLKHFLKEIKDVEIKISKDTIYCMDNDFHRFLCALNCKINFNENDRKYYSESWDKSVAETKRLLRYISSLKPHVVKDTLSLNDARKIIVNLAKPMADINQNILKSKQTARQASGNLFSDWQKYVDDLNGEKVIITRASIKFGAFLKQNSIVPYNDALGEYLSQLILEENDRVQRTNDRKTLDSLQIMKNQFNEEVRILNEEMRNREVLENLTPNYIDDLVKTLYSLPHNGENLKRIVDVVIDSKSQIIKYEETHYKPKKIIN